MPRKKRKNSQTRTPVQDCLERIRTENQLTGKRMAEIAGCSQSVVAGCLTGAMPSESVGKLKKLCNHFGISLSEALTGDPDQFAQKPSVATASVPVESTPTATATAAVGSRSALEAELEHLVSKQPLFEGYLDVKIMGLVPKPQR